MYRLGVVSFLNARPLIHGLAARPDVECVFDVPSALPARLELGEVDVALIPVIDVLRAGGRYQVVSDACIGSDGETMTVRVFSRVPPDRIRKLYYDTDSHTSIALATVLWRELFGQALTLQPAGTTPLDAPDVDAVLLIGDKVVDSARASFGYEVDLGGAWRQHTGLPFVFAGWAVGAERAADMTALATLLNEARDAGVAAAAEIALTEGPRRGWPAELAHRYLTRCLRFVLDARAVAGVQRFAALCAAADLVPRDARFDFDPTLAGRTGAVS